MSKRRGTNSNYGRDDFNKKVIERTRNLVISPLLRFTLFLTEGRVSRV